MKKYWLKKIYIFVSNTRERNKLFFISYNNISNNREKAKVY